MRHDPSGYDSVQAAPLLTKSDVARALAVSVKTVERLVAADRLRPVKILGATRFRPGDVNALTERGAAASTTEPNEVLDPAGRRGRAGPDGDGVRVAQP